MIHYTQYQIDGFTFYVPLQSGYENPVYLQKAYQLDVINGDQAILFEGPDIFGESPPPWHLFVVGGIVNDTGILKDTVNFPDSGAFNSEYPSPAVLAAAGCAYYSSPGINQIVYDSSSQGMTAPNYIPVIRRHTRRAFVSPIPAIIGALLLLGTSMMSQTSPPPARRRRRKRTD